MDQPQGGFTISGRSAQTYWSLHATTKNPNTGKVCKSKHLVTLPKEKNGMTLDTHVWVERTQFLDTCGAFNIISREELHDIKPAEEHGMRSMRMRCLEATTGWYRDVGKSYAKDEKGKTKMRLAYAYDTKSETKTSPFYLIAMSTLVEERIDLQYHMQESLKGRCPMLRRMPEVNPFQNKERNHYPAIPRTDDMCLLLQHAPPQHPPEEDVGTEMFANDDPTPPALGACPQSCTCEPRVVQFLHSEAYNLLATELESIMDPEEEMDAAASCPFPQAQKMDAVSAYHSIPLKGPDEDLPQGEHIDWDRYVKAAYPHYAPLDELSQYDAESYRCYMTEIQLQAIVSQQGIDSSGSSELDMMTINGRKVSKWSLEALHFGKPVEPPLKTRVLKFLEKYVGEKRVFPTKNGAPRIMTEFESRPYKYELRDEYTKGPNPRPLPSIKATYYHGKPATQKVLEHFVRSVPVVSRCDDPRCLSRLVIVPKREPGALKSADPTSYRVTMNALINGCLKPTPSTLPLALNETKKLHHYKYYLKVDAANAYWSIPLDDESRRMTAFQTHEGVFAWDRLTMGTRPASTVQQTAYYRAFDRYLPAKWRHRFASFADDIAAGADTLEELFELLQAIVICCDKAGIQIKASKVVFGVEEISFHNYTISAHQTRPKDENLDPIKNSAIPQSVTHVKAFLGCTQQMAHYCQYYGIVASPLHELTRDKTPFPSPWLPGTDYDISFRRLKTMMLNGSLFLWNKVNSRRLFIEVDACEYADDPSEGPFEDEGRHRLLSKRPKRVVEWISKAWTDYERDNLPTFYREALGRLLCLEHFRNLIETQEVNAGTTVYTDHAPSTYKGSLSNKGKLSSWRIHETQDLADVVQTLYKGGVFLGPPHGLADPLSRIPRGESFYRLQLPAVLDILLEHLPPVVKTLKHIRVNAEKDTVLAARVVQRWRTPKNPISTIRSDAPGPCEFLITAPFSDKCTHLIAKLIRDNRSFAALVPVDLLHRIDQNKSGKIDQTVKARREKMPTIVISPLALVWLISHPDHALKDKPSIVLFQEATAESLPQQEQFSMEEVAKVDHVAPNLAAFMLCRNKLRIERDDRANCSHMEFIDKSLQSLDALFVDGAVRHGGGETYRLYAQTRAGKKQQKRNDKRNKGAKATARSTQALTRTSGCKRGVATSSTSFDGSPDPDPLAKWVGQQGEIVAPPKGEVLHGDMAHYPKGLRAIKDDSGRIRIVVPPSQRTRLIKKVHLTVLHVGGLRVYHVIKQKYYWPGMKDAIVKTCSACPDCQKAMMQRKHLNAEFEAAREQDLPLPRTTYGIDFYGHAKGEILVAIDLITREISLWFMKERKQETVAKALLTGLVFTKGVPLTFRSDEAAEFVSGVVSVMNKYLGIKQITTGGHNARGNATVERVMQTVGHMLRTSKQAEYDNIKEYVQCMAFGHNCTYNSVIKMSPFEAGHGLPARTISDARLDLPRLQLTAEEGNASDGAVKLWEKGLPKKVIDLAHSMAETAKRNSEWQRRMNTEHLNATGRKIDTNDQRDPKE